MTIVPKHGQANKHDSPLESPVPRQGSLAMQRFSPFPIPTLAQHKPIHQNDNLSLSTINDTIMRITCIQSRRLNPFAAFFLVACGLPTPTWSIHHRGRWSAPSTMRGQKRWSTSWPPASLPPSRYLPTPGAMGDTMGDTMDHGQKKHHGQLRKTRPLEVHSPDLSVPGQVILRGKQPSKKGG